MRGGGGYIYIYLGVTVDAEIRSLNSVENPELTKDPSFEPAVNQHTDFHASLTAKIRRSRYFHRYVFPLLLGHRVTCAMNNVSDVYL